MRFSFKIPLFITLFFVVTVYYTFVTMDSEWVKVFWAAYKNLMIIGCLYFMMSYEKPLWSDRLFIRSCLLVNGLQTLLYLICPFSTDKQKVFYFDIFAWFVVLVSLTTVIIYIYELVNGKHAK